MPDLFQLVMEAEGDLIEPFDAGGPDADVPTEVPDQQSSTDSSNMSSEAPPPLNEDEDMQFPGSDEMGMGGELGDDGTDDGGGEAQSNEEKKISEKANNILNQRLYQQMLDRNSEVEEIINNLQTITPTLPYEIVKQNDVSLNRLKKALTAGQDYVIDKFVNAKYGENLLYFRKLDVLYTAILGEINTNLKKANKS